MNLLTALSAVLKGRLLVTALFRKYVKESIMKSLPLLVKRRARLLAKESINKLHKMQKGNALFVPLDFSLSRLARRLL